MQKVVENKSLGHLVCLVFLTRFVACSGVRLFYPLAPFFEEEFGLSRSEIGAVLAASEVSAIPALFIASLGDKYSVRYLSSFATILMGLSYAALSLQFTNMLLLLLFSRITFIFGYQILFTLSLAVIYGAVSEKVKVQVTGIIELSWGLSVLVSIPVISFAFKKMSYKTIFLIIALINILLSFDVLYKFPTHHENKDRTVVRPTLKQMVQNLHHKSVYFYNISGFFFMLTHTGVFIILAFILKDEFDIEVSDIGLTFFVMGIAEVTGVIFLTLISRFASTKTLYNGAYIATALILVLFVTFSVSSGFEMLLLHIAGIFFLSEYIVVFTIADTGAYVQSKYRSTVLSFHAVCMFLGRALGALIGERIYSTSGTNVVLVYLGVSLLLSGGLLKAGEHYKREFDIEENISFNQETKEDVILS